MNPAIASRTIVAATTISKIKRRILPLLFLFYIVAYLDRINIGFAAFTMTRELDITSSQLEYSQSTPAECTQACVLLDSHS